MKFISMMELKDIYDRLGKNELILDVRTDLEFSEGHVPKSKHIPYELVMNHRDELQKFDQVYVYCKAGGRSYNACMVLQSLGLTQLTCIDEGGMPDWTEAGFPLEKS